MTGRVRRVDCVRRGRSLSNSAATGWAKISARGTGEGVGHATFRTVRVDKTLGEVRGQCVWRPPKTRASARKVDLP
jgi:hypothetical protein